MNLNDSIIMFYLLHFSTFCDYYYLFDQAVKIWYCDGLKEGYFNVQSLHGNSTMVTYCVWFELGDLLWLAWPKVVHPDDVIRASCSQEHTTWTHKYILKHLRNKHSSTMNFNINNVKSKTNTHMNVLCLWMQIMCPRNFEVINHIFKVISQNRSIISMTV